VSALFLEGFNRDFAQGNFNAEPGGHQVAVLLERMKHAAANGSAANHSKIHLLHRAQRLSVNRAGDNSILNAVSAVSAFDSDVSGAPLTLIHFVSVCFHFYFDPLCFFEGAWPFDALVRWDSV
jgi:hypothetical protein